MTEAAGRSQITPGDPTSERLWHELHDRLLGFIRPRVPGEADAEDVLQEVFLRLERHLDGLDEPRAVVGWIFRVTTNVIADHYRRQAKAEDIEGRLRSEHESSSESKLGPGEDPVSELGACVVRFIEALPEPYGEALMLTELKGLTQGEAAEKVGISLSGMKSRVQRGRQKLRGLFEACCRIELDSRGGIVDYEPRNGRRSPE